MTSRLKKHVGLLNQLNKAKPKLRKAILQGADWEIIKCLCDCCHNILNGNIPLTPSQKKKVNRCIKDVRLLGSRKGNLRDKQALLVQKGGLVSAILAPLLAVAASLLSEWMVK